MAEQLKRELAHIDARLIEDRDPSSALNGTNVSGKIDGRPDYVFRLICILTADLLRRFKRDDVSMDRACIDLGLTIAKYASDKDAISITLPAGLVGGDLNVK